MAKLRQWLSKRSSDWSRKPRDKTSTRRTAIPDEELHESRGVLPGWTPSPKQEKHIIGFLDLPRELRDCIYHHCLVLEQPFDLGNFDTMVESKRQATFYLGWNRYPIAGQILSTCKQVHAEAAPILYGENHFETSLSADDSVALTNFLEVNEAAQKFSNDRRIPDRLMTLPFHPTYQPLVVNRSFRTGTRFQDRDGGLKFLLPMMYSLRNVEGAFFRAQSLRHQSPRCFRGDVYVAGWRRKGYEKPLSAHNKHDCESSITFDLVSDSDEVVLAVFRMSDPSRADYMETKAPFALKHLRYKVHVHACLTGSAQPGSQQSFSMDHILRRHDVMKVVYVFTPLPTNDLRRIG